MSRVRTMTVLVVLVSAAVGRAESPPAPAAATPEGAAPAEPAPKPVAAPNVEALLEQIARRSAELDRREAALAEQERSIGSLQAEVDRRLAELESLRSAIEERLASWKRDAGDQVQRLAKLYTEMPPAQSAALLEKLEPGLATDVLRKMKNKPAASALALMSEAQALRLSKRVAYPLSQLPASASKDAASHGAGGGR